jgi:hypothetical protein
MRLVPQQLAIRIAIGGFLPWYFVEMPKAIVDTYFAYVRAFWEIFSFPFLLRTLLLPWKNVLDPYPKNRLDIAGIFQTLVMNTMSRLIGCLFRLVMMVLGLVTHACCLVLFAAWLTLWMTFPLLAVLGWMYLIMTILT